MRKWDVVILGANGGGVLAGAILAKKGFSVLIVEEKAKAGPSRRKYRFRRFSNLSELLLSRHVVEGIYQWLGIPLARGEFAHRDDLTCQIILPGHRVDISPNRTDLLEQMKSEFPGDFDLIETLYARLGEEDWVRRTMMARGGEKTFLDRIGRRLVRRYHTSSDRPLSAFLAPLRKNNALARFIDVQIKSMSYLFMEDSPFGLARHLMGILVQDDVLMDMMGPQGLMDRVKGEMMRGGGRIITLESLEGIRIEKSEGEFRITTRGKGQPMASRVCIGTIPFRLLRKLIPTAFSGKKWAERSERLWPKYFIFSLNLGIDAEGIPVGLGDCFISLRDVDAPYKNGNLLMACMGPEGVGAPAGKRSMTINTLVPVGEAAGIEGIIQEMLDHVLEVAPFLDRSIRVMDGRPPTEGYRGQWTTRDIIYGGTLPFRVGDAILPTTTPLEGLYLACRENFPYLGFEGEILSGIKAAQAILRHFS